MKGLDFVFVVLVYRNAEDLLDFFDNYRVPNSKVVVVNSYYDEPTDRKFHEIANRFDADFITVPNKGYGAGNNKGCEYALNNYQFRYLVISNADVTIEKLGIESLKKYENSIIAPKIINRAGRNQNPSVPFKPSYLLENFRRWIYIGNHTKIIWAYFVLSRFKKVLFYAISRVRKKIFSAHGSFIILPEQVVKKIYPLYNEDMFLFNEEEHLGRLALKNGIETYYVPNIIIHHKEDGSISLSNINEFEKLKQSYLVYYHYWIG